MSVLKSSIAPGHAYQKEQYHHAQIGRQQEVAATRDTFICEGVRLLTLTGPGGIGKTRLGLQVATELLDQFEQGIFFVSLADIGDPDLVASKIAQPLDVSEAGSQPLLEILSAPLKVALPLMQNRLVACKIMTGHAAIEKQATSRMWPDQSTAWGMWPSIKAITSGPKPGFERA